MVEDTRARLRAAAPAAYRWWIHVVLIVSFQLAGMVFAVASLQRVRVIELAALPVFLLLILFGEWASHRYTMHRRVFPRAVYHRHVVEHHAFFSRQHMAIDTYDDLRWVLFPPWALPLLIVSILPLFASLHWLAAANFAWLFLLAVIGYYSVYEIFHVLTHLQPGGGTLGHFHAAISRHHSVHHDPALMDRWNFNFMVPLFDWLLGTKWRADRKQP